MDDIAQDPAGSTPAERVARGRAVWDSYRAEYPFAELPDVIADLMHLADEDVPGGAETVLDRAEMHHGAERSDGTRRPEGGGAADRPYADALAVDSLGRPLCEGTTYRATRNCAKTADFQLKKPGAQNASGYACEAHAGQLARTLADGEARPDCELRLIPITTKE